MEAEREWPNRENSTGRRLKEILAVLGRYDLIHGISPEKLRHILEDLGPTFIKLGQIMSMRQDMLPDEYCKELTLLRADVKPMEFSEVISVIEDEYGEEWNKNFRSINEKPVGSASIAQVHEAVLTDGRDVVIKVQRPGIYRKMAQDIRLLHKASGLLRFISGTGRVIDLNVVIEEMWTVAKQEMDFLIEAGHVEEFIKLNSDVQYVAFPHIEWNLTTSKVLVMERIDGLQPDDCDALRNAGYDLKEIAEKLAASYVKQVIEDGFFHADPHPGNIRIRDGKIVWIDLGMVGTISSHDRQLLKSAMKSIVRNDIFALKNALLGLGKHTGKINHSQLNSNIEDMLTKYGSLELGSIDIGDVFIEILTLADQNGISIPAGISMLSRGMLTIEGVLRNIDPETNILHIFSYSIADSLLQDFDPETEIKRMAKSLYLLGNRSSEIPADLTGILKMAARGQSKFNIEMVGSEEPLARIGKMVDKLIVGILNAALLIGSSLICLTSMEPKILGIPLLGILGYFASFVLSVWLLYGIIHKKRFK